MTRASTKWVARTKARRCARCGTTIRARNGITLFSVLPGGETVHRTCNAKEAGSEKEDGLFEAGGAGG